jgi:sugar-specific transcriptional regulator TrmB
MEVSDNVEESIEVLQQLGLKEYEARCFVGLSRVQTATAKQVSEMTEVPRTRVYDAIRVLEAQGLVEIQHSSPQEFRAVPLTEAIDTLRDQYESRIERLQGALDGVDSVDQDEDSSIQEVWGMSGQDGIENRTDQLIQTANEEVVLVLGHESILTDDLVDTLNGLPKHVDLLVGSVSESLQDDVQRLIPNATAFLSGLDWLKPSDSDDEITIGRLLLVDRSAILVSSVIPETGKEQAIFGEGFGNGLVVIARRLMAQGLLPGLDPTV